MRTSSVGTLAAAAAVVLAIGVAGSARGHGFGHGGGFGRMGELPDHGPGGGPLLLELIFPCRADCAEQGHVCADTARADAVGCAEQACATEITAAQTACQADNTSDACQRARSALATCAATCLESGRTALDACRTTIDDCLTTCGNT